MDATDERIRRCEEALEGLIRMYRIYWLFRDNLGFDKMKAQKKQKGTLTAPFVTVHQKQRQKMQ